MASTSSSPVQKSFFKYDVFLSFRGEDTRKTFVDHLYVALVNRGIITYKDDETIEKGERINDQLLRSIEDSRCYIIVFSKNYASSSWCLDELVKIMECQKTTEQTAYPVFYDVEPTEVRNQSGSVGEAFAQHVDKEVAGRWRNALKQASDLAGWELKNTFDGHEAKFIQQIIQDISLKLHLINLIVDKKLVGMETRVKDIVSSLEINTDDVRMIGIKGMGGGGKTTLARAIFNYISIWFEGKSFVENVREGSKGFGLMELQKQVLQDVLNDQSITRISNSDLDNMMKKMMCGRKVIVVLDDVDDVDQLEALAGELTWFKPGSRIIITTRDEQVLVAHGVNVIHEINLLAHEEAICLLSRYAFKREIPNQGYEELSRKVVHYAAGLPLTIKVLGSHLYGRTKHEWVDAIERLKTIPLEKMLKRLELSYNGLENDEKEIFLDVVCILKGEMKERAIRILESCGYNAEIGLRVLEQKSLITISNIDGLRFHDHIEEMAWNIVRRLHPDDPSKHTRLWIKEEIEDIFVNELGTSAIKSIKLKNTDLHPTTIMKGLRNMKELRFLHVDNGYREWIVDEVSPYLPDALRSLYWYGYPFQSLPKTFRANKLVNLEMAESNMSEVWKGEERKVLDKVRFIDLRYSKLRTFDLGMTPNIEILNLEVCKDLVELHMPIMCQKLKLLNLGGTKVRNLNLGQTPQLERLHLLGCYYLQEIHAPVGCLQNLVDIELYGCLRFRRFVVFRSNNLPSAYSLAALDLIAESLDTCPLHPNNNLPKFQFKCDYEEPLSSSSGNIEKLLSFGLCACTNLESFSTSICGLQQLGELILEGSIPEVPKDLWRLESLDMLTLWMKEIKHLPDSICKLKHLKCLNLESCCNLEQLPEDLGRLEGLEILDLTDCSSLRDIPNSIGNMKCLTELNMKGAGITSLPQSIYQLKGLRITVSRGQLDWHRFRSLTDGLFDYDVFMI